MDRRLGISTAIPPNFERPDRNDRNQRYEPLTYPGLRAISDLLKLQPGDVLYDLGCGKGRIVCWFAREPIKKSEGIDLDASLTREASKNAQALIGRRAPIEINTGDAPSADYSEATVVTLYNPFGAEVMRLVLENLTRSLVEHPRRLRLVYASPAHIDVFAEFPQFPEVDRISIPYDLGAMTVVFFEAK